MKAELKQKRSRYAILGRAEISCEMLDVAYMAKQERE